MDSLVANHYVTHDRLALELLCRDCAGDDEFRLRQPAQLKGNLALQDDVTAVGWLLGCRNDRQLRAEADCGAALPLKGHGAQTPGRGGSAVEYIV